MTRSSVALLALVAVVQLAACDAPAPEAPPSPTSTSGAPSPAPTLSAEGYLYTSKEGIRALATFDGAAATLELANTTGAAIGAPGIYLLDATTGEVLDADVAPARGLPDGERRTYRVRLARPVAPAQIGLVVLTIGGEDRGAFLPPAAAEGDG